MKTREQLIEDFKTINGRPDWTEDDFAGAEQEAVFRAEEILMQAYMFPSLIAMPDEILNQLNAQLDLWKVNISNEIARRGN